MHVPAYFGTRPQDINAVCDIDIDEITRELSSQVEHWNSRGSGFIIERVSNFVLCITKFRPLHGSSYIPTPKRILDKHCTVNVKNQDQKCIVWSALASLYPASDNVSKPYKYFPYEHSLNTTNLNFQWLSSTYPNSRCSTLHQRQCFVARQERFLYRILQPRT